MADGQRPDRTPVHVVAHDLGLSGCFRTLGCDDRQDVLLSVLGIGGDEDRQQRGEPGDDGRSRDPRLHTADVDPSLKRSVVTSAANVEISATPPTAAELDRPRIIAFVRNGVRSATATVKTISDRMKPVTLIAKSSKTSDATMSPTALPSRTIDRRTMNRITAPEPIAPPA